MAIDNKYGRVTFEHGTIGEDEPVVVFRANDILLPKVLMYYHLFCMKAGSPRHHLNLILDSLEKVRAWQDEKSEEEAKGYVKGVFKSKHPIHIPNSDSYVERMIASEEGLE